MFEQNLKILRRFHDIFWLSNVIDSCHHFKAIAWQILFALHYKSNNWCTQNFLCKSLFTTKSPPLSPYPLPHYFCQFPCLLLTNITYPTLLLSIWLSLLPLPLFNPLTRKLNSLFNSLFLPTIQFWIAICLQNPPNFQFLYFSYHIPGASAVKKFCIDIQIIWGLIKLI